MRPRRTQSNPRVPSPATILSRGDTGPIERVVLLGYMCSGKSSVGESLARRLNWSFVDFDVEIERRENRAVRSIIEAEA